LFGISVDNSGLFVTIDDDVIVLFIVECVVDEPDG
jgi:hypothetical protein